MEGPSERWKGAHGAGKEHASLEEEEEGRQLLSHSLKPTAGRGGSRPPALRHDPFCGWRGSVRGAPQCWTGHLQSRTGGWVEAGLSQPPLAATLEPEAKEGQSHRPPLAQDQFMFTFMEGWCS